MSISYEYYKIFYYVGKYQSFSKAARILNNSQPNITRTMNILESELGCQLFIRSHQGVSLTADGEKLFSHVKAAHKQLQFAESELHSPKNPQTERISIGFSIGITEILLHDKILPTLHDYHLLYPNTRIQIINNSTPNLVEEVKKGSIDMAVVTSYERADSNLHMSVLHSFRDILIGGPSFAHLKDKKMRLNDLVQYPIINLWQGTETFEFYYQLFASQGLKFEPEVETATTDQVLSFVSNDMGLGFISPEYSRTALKNGEVFQINLAENLPVRNISLIHNIEKPLNFSAHILEDMICGSN